MQNQNENAETYVFVIWKHTPVGGPYSRSRIGFAFRMAIHMAISDHRIYYDPWEYARYSGWDDMVYNEQLADRIQNMVRHKGLSEKKMFGGVAFLLNGNMCFGVAKDDLMVRVGPERYEDALSLPNARPMDITGHAMKGFVFVDSKGWSKNTSLKKWLELGLEYAASLPKKK